MLFIKIREQREARRLRIRRIVIATFIFLLSGLTTYAMASGIISCEIVEKEWTWDPGGIAVFEGTVTYEGSAAENPLTLHLSLECSPAVTNAGEINFSSVNGVKLSKMKQKSDYVVREDGPEGFRFTGNWIIPDGLDTVLTSVRIILTVSDQDGNRLAETSFMTERAAEEDSVSANFRFPDLSRWIPAVLIAAAVIWIAAIARIIYYKRRSD